MQLVSRIEVPDHAGSQARTESSAHLAQTSLSAICSRTAGRLLDAGQPHDHPVLEETQDGTAHHGTSTASSTAGNRATARRKAALPPLPPPSSVAVSQRSQIGYVHRLDRNRRVLATEGHVTARALERDRLFLEQKIGRLLGLEGQQAPIVVITFPLPERPAISQESARKTLDLPRGGKSTPATQSGSIDRAGDSREQGRAEQSTGAGRQEEEERGSGQRTGVAAHSKLIFSPDCQLDHFAAFLLEETLQHTAGDALRGPNRKHGTPFSG